MEGLKCLHHISEAFSAKICRDYFDYDNTGDFDGSIFIFWARLIVSSEGGFFIQTTTTTTLGSAVLIPSEDSLGVAATSPRQRKNGEGATLRFSFVRGRVQLHVGYSEDGGWSLAHSESILTQQMANQGNIQGHPTTVSSKMHWKYFLGYSEYF